MEYIGKEKFGTFKTNGVIRAIPTRPWITDSYPGDLSGRGKGDIRATHREILVILEIQTRMKPIT
ncbi:hypothetical protein C1147_07605 [Clostridium botulinum]|nr:hypothetical protein C1147_07605 [Clostridium botulinum]